MKSKSEFNTKKINLGIKLSIRKNKKSYQSVEKMHKTQKISIPIKNESVPDSPDIQIKHYDSTNPKKFNNTNSSINSNNNTNTNDNKNNNTNNNTNNNNTNNNTNIYCENMKEILTLDERSMLVNILNFPYIESTHRIFPSLFIKCNQCNHLQSFNKQWIDCSHTKCQNKNCSNSICIFCQNNHFINKNTYNEYDKINGNMPLLTQSCPLSIKSWIIQRKIKKLGYDANRESIIYNNEDIWKIWKLFCFVVDLYDYITKRGYIITFNILTQLNRVSKFSISEIKFGLNYLPKLKDFYVNKSAPSLI